MHPSTFFALLEQLFQFSKRPPHPLNPWILEQIVETLDAGMDDEYINSSSYPSTGTWDGMSTPDQAQQQAWRQMALDPPSGNAHPLSTNHESLEDYRATEQGAIPSTTSGPAGTNDVSHSQWQSDFGQVVNPSGATYRHSSSTPTADSQSGPFYSTIHSESGSENYGSHQPALSPVHSAFQQTQGGFPQTGNFPQTLTSDAAWPRVAQGTHNMPSDPHAGEQHMVRSGQPVRSTTTSSASSVASFPSAPHSAPSVHLSVSRKAQEARVELENAKTDMIRTGVKMQSSNIQEDRQTERLKFRIAAYKEITDHEVELRQKLLAVRRTHYVDAYQWLNNPALRDYTTSKQKALEAVNDYFDTRVPGVNLEARFEKVFTTDAN